MIKVNKSRNIIFTFPFFRIGGQENLIVSTLKELKQKNIKFKIITLYIDANIYSEIEDLKQCFVKPSKFIENILKIRIFRYLFSIPTYTLLLLRNIQKNSTIVSFGTFSTYLTCLIKFFYKNLEIIYYECDVKIPNKIKINYEDNYQKLVQFLLINFQDIFDNLLLKNVNKMIVIDDKNLEYAKLQYNQIINHFELIYPLLSLKPKKIPSKIDNEPIINLFKNDIKYLLIVGTLDARKNTIQALRLISFLRFNKLNYELIVVGGGELENQLKNAAAELNISNKVHFLGKVSYLELDYIYSKIYCNLFFAQYQTWGLTPFEALMFNKPSIVSAEAGCSEYLMKKSVNHIHKPDQDFKCCLKFLEKDCKNFKYEYVQLYELLPEYHINSLLSIIF
jgi:glycosyltransferase involved in cell wall biosynthesis